ncbi:MAG: hypothetical protein KatS3mg088_111 [Patescibacteria group bacterium]|nr:MAG: hypothetical protein KatS3mg088_111 [Patescibacteria group bacterium]
METELFSFPVWEVVKWFFLFAFFLYIIFSLVIIRQVNLMNKTLEVNFEKPIALLSYIHFLFAVGVFIFAFLAL